MTASHRPPSTALDPDALDDVLKLGTLVPPAYPFDIILLAQEDRHGNDDLDELGAGVGPRTPAQALRESRRMSREDVYVGVGYCLKTVRTFYGVAALYPDAETAWEESRLKHPTSDPRAIPRGAVPFWTNGRYGHVALSAGGGMCWTTDYRRPGYVDLAPIANLATWCGGRLAGWAEDINGVDVWNPKPAREFTIDDRINYVSQALERAQRRPGGPQEWRTKGLSRWLDQLVARRAELNQRGNQ